MHSKGYPSYTSRMTAVTFIALGVLAGSDAGARDRGVSNTSSSPHVRLRSVDPDAVRWSEGFWADRFALCRGVMLPHMRRAMTQPTDNAAVLNNFAVAAGLEEGKLQGTNWGDGDCYKFLEAVAHVYGLTKDKELDRLMDHYIGIIAEAQEPNGYLSTPIQLSDKRRWQRTQHHELYNMGHLLTAACVHHRATGKDTFLRIARKLGDYLYTVFKPRPPELAHYGWNPSNIMGLAELYRTTRDRRYLELAGIFVDMRGSAPGGGDQNQDHVPLREEQKVVGHAVTAAYLYCGAADVYAETGEKALLDALQRLWRNMTTRKMSVTGGIGALHRGKSARGDPVHEAFAPDYQLPNRTAYNETCANIGNAMWNWRMLGLTGDAKYADVMESVLYNSMLSGIGIGGTDFFYTNPLSRHGPEVPLLSNDTVRRWTTYRCYCCPPNVVRTIAKLHGWAYSLSQQGVWVNLYGGNVLKTRLTDGSPLALIQETNYPWDGKVKITVAEAGKEEFVVMLRIPGWAEEAALKVNSQQAAADTKPGTYAAVRRKWSAGDVIELDLPMEVRLMEANPAVENLRGQVSVMRGPIVYCLESPDLPANVSVFDVAVPANIELRPRFDKGLLGGISVLEGKAVLSRQRAHDSTAREIQESDWPDVLYRELTERPGTIMDEPPVTIKLIPYYAWANRGVSQMTVWLPLAFAGDAADAPGPHWPGRRGVRAVAFNSGFSTPN